MSRTSSTFDYNEQQAKLYPPLQRDEIRVTQLSSRALASFAALDEKREAERIGTDGVTDE